MEAYPPNSQKAVASVKEPKKVEKVVSADAKRRKKSLGKQFKETFVGGDARSAAHYVFFSVLIPAAKDALADAGSQGIERLIYGEARRRPSPPGGGNGYVNYQRMSQAPSRGPAPRQMTRRARQRHDFDEIILSTRGEGEDVLERMYEILSKYGEVSVGDLYELTGLPSTHADLKWGWTDLHGSSVRKIRSEGYLIDLPQPEPLDD